MDQFNIIRHKYQVEGLSVRKIALELGLSRNTIRKYCKGDISPAKPKISQKYATKLEFALHKIREYLANPDNRFTQKQRITVPRLLQLIPDLSDISRSTTQLAWSEYKRSQAEVFIPLIHRPGDEAQVDFFEVVVNIAGKDRKVWMLLIRLVYSGLDYINLYDHCDQVSLMHGHMEAFKAFGGVPRRAVYDNLTPVVTKVLLTGRKLNQRFQNFAAHYCLECNFARPGEGHDKGAVESRGKSIRLQYATPIPKGESLEEIARLLREQIAARRSLNEEEIARGCEELDALQVLPGCHFEVRKTVPVSVSSKSTFQYDNVVYSLPETWARLQATIHVGPFLIEVSCQQGQFTHYRGLPGEKKIIYKHYVRELSKKPAAVRQIAPELLAELDPSYKQLWDLLDKAHGPQSAARVLAKLMAVIEQGNESELTQALTTALNNRKAQNQPLILPKVMQIPTALSGHEIESSTVSGFDRLLKVAS